MWKQLRSAAGAVGLVEVDSGDDAAASAVGQGGLASGGGSPRDLLQKIRSMRSVVPQFVSDLERAEHIIATLADNAQDSASLPGRLSIVLDALTDAHSALTKELSETSTDHKTHKTPPNVADFRAFVSEGLARADEVAQHSKAVAVGDAKREQVDSLAAAAAAAAVGGGSMAVCGAAAATRKPMNKPKRYGRPSLCGLPEDVFSHMGSLMTTKMSACLAKVNKDIRTMAIDETSGLFREFTVTEDEEDSYSKVEDVNKEMQHMDKMKTASVWASDVESRVVLSEYLESCRTTLESLTLDVRGCAKEVDASDCDVAFLKLTFLHPHNSDTIRHIRRRRWIFPALTTLRVGRIYSDEDAASLVRLLHESPKIERLEGDRIGLDYRQWADFTAALGRCPYLTTITGLEIDIPSQFGRLNRLKDALRTHWSSTPEKRGVRKKLEFVTPHLSIGVDYRQRRIRMADVEAFRKWAVDVGCELEWELGGYGWVTLDCSSGAATVLPAPGGLYGDIATRLAANATIVVLDLGGAPLHESWRHKLICHNATTLEIDIKRGASASEVVDSIPTWLSERKGDGQGATSRCFPAVEQLTVRSSSLFLAELRAASSKLRPFLGRLTTLKRVDLDGVSSFAAASEPLSYFAVGELDEVECCEPIGCVVCERPADASGTLGDRCPRIHRLTSSHLRSKAGVAEFIKLALAVRPVSVELVAVLDESELEGKRKATKLADLRSFADECAMRVTPHYTVEKSECELVGWKKYCLGIKHT
ncbi:unnamed protein product [Vitrella brassicaformis CCMP3155]|uniref:Uncharacterized protein n=2 Tax=Vitrella brassicaformis TaxID=1169539 RepID=A0A0G4EUC8_VITBC|nr:unnamed protein product [Vitrella brassicaformis CCMP3155]|eukprot:CEM01695.1 unnamed protein product [Vitrella brassicaformis CCMP3155]